MYPQFPLLKLFKLLIGPFYFLNPLKTKFFTIKDLNFAFFIHFHRELKIICLKAANTNISRYFIISQELQTIYI